MFWAAFVCVEDGTGGRCCPRQRKSNPSDSPLRFWRPASAAPRCYALRELGILPIEPLPALRPHMAIAKRILPGVAIMSGTLDGVRPGGTRFGGGAGDDVFFGVNLTGESTARQGDRELNMRSGDAGFFVGVESDVCITRPTPVRFVGLRVPLKTLELVLTLSAWAQ